MFCKNCGTEMDDNTTFCPKCGAAQSAPETQTPPPADRVTQQVPPQQPQTAGLAPATEAEKNAYFKSAGSVLMLVVCIVGTLSLVFGIIAPLLSFQLVSFIFGLIGSILTILIVVGMWIAWANAKKNTLNPTGIKLIRIPYIIQFIFTVIGFAVVFITGILAITALGATGEATGTEAATDVGIGALVFALIQPTIIFIFDCIIFASLNKTLKAAQCINNNTTAVGQKAGKALGIVLIIAAVINIILGIVGLILNPLGFMSLISTIIETAFWIIGAVILLGFAKNLNSAHGQN